jgi:hypothetical protein
LPLDRFVGLPFTGTFEDSGDFGQEIAAPGRELAQFGHCGRFFGLGELSPPGVTSSDTSELGDEDPVGVRLPAILRCGHHRGPPGRTLSDLAGDTGIEPVTSSV